MVQPFLQREILVQDRFDPLGPQRCTIFMAKQYPLFRSFLPTVQGICLYMCFVAQNIHDRWCTGTSLVVDLRSRQGAAFGHSSLT